MSLEGVAGVCLSLSVLWILISGLDDLFINAVFLLCRRPLARLPTAGDLAVTPRRRIAILVPLWEERDVIRRMLERNLSIIRYPDYDIFAGVYPNDPATAEAVREVCARYENVHIALCPHDGPTSKADCLNWIYRRMEAFERARGVRFEIVVTHDAEDLVHARELELINYFACRYDMVQIPVLPLPTPLTEWVHGLYCDEFAEFQLKDIPARQRLGGFLPSNGVGTGFTRQALEELAAKRGGRVFEPDCLTEDYENGFAIHALGRPQIFVPVRFEEGAFIATREYFPQRFGKAVRQRVRWVTGIALQGWARHGWRVPPRQLYWFWRDRKGLIGNLLAPVANLAFVVGICRQSRGLPLLDASTPEWFSSVWAATLTLSALQMSIRAGCAAYVYGWSFASGVPLRALIGNWVNGGATIRALWRFTAARLRGSALAWGKTSHQYPQGRHLRPHMPRLGELLVELRYLARTDLDRALRSQPAGQKLGEYLVELQMIGEDNLYHGLSLQFGIPLGDPARRSGTGAARRVLPAEVTERWQAVAVDIAGGELHVGVADAPPAKLKRELQQFCSLPVRYWLYPPSSLRRMVGGELAAGAGQPR